MVGGRRRGGEERDAMRERKGGRGKVKERQKKDAKVNRRNSVISLSEMTGIFHEDG